MSGRPQPKKRGAASQADLDHKLASREARSGALLTEDGKSNSHLIFEAAIAQRQQVSHKGQLKRAHPKQAEKKQ